MGKLPPEDIRGIGLSDDQAMPAQEAVPPMEDRTVDEQSRAEMATSARRNARQEH